MKIEIDGGRRSVEVQEVRIDDTMQSMLNRMGTWIARRTIGKTKFGKNNDDLANEIMRDVSFKVSYYDATDGGTIERWVYVSELADKVRAIKEMRARLEEMMSGASYQTIRKYHVRTKTEQEGKK